MRMRFRTVLSCIFLFSFTLFTFAQFGQYSTRSLLEKKIYYVAGGKIGSCNYWSLPLGKFDCTLNRYFPGEGKIDIEATLNFAILSSGYVEGHGYGSKGKIGSEAKLAIDNGADTLQPIDLTDIDYVFNNGRSVKLKNNAAPTPLILACEKNQLTIKGMSIMVWVYDKVFNELKHNKDIDGVTAFSFTKQGALHALRAQK